MSDKHKPTVKLVGEDGNVFSIIGNVSKVLKKECGQDTAKEFTERAFGAQSYDEVLNLCHEYVEVT